LVHLELYFLSHKCRSNAEAQKKENGLGGSIPFCLGKINN
jgi:hypothetical protein